MKKATILAAVLAALLQGCSGLTQNLIQNVPENYQLSPESGDGLIVVSTRFISDNCPAIYGSSAIFSISNVENLMVRGDYLFMKSPMISDDPGDPTRRLFVRRLPAGKYSLRELSYVRPADRPAAFKIDIPFVVGAGQAHYLGELTVTAQTCRDLDIKVSNRKTEDLAGFSNRVKAIPQHLVKDQILVYDPSRKERIR